MSKMIYDSFYEALAAKGVTVEVFKSDTDTWKVRVLAPLYIEKDYILGASWGMSYTADEVYKDVRHRLGRLYNVYKTEGYITG